MLTSGFGRDVEARGQGMSGQRYAVGRAFVRDGEFLRHNSPGFSRNARHIARLATDVQERAGEPLESLRATFEQALDIGILLQPRSAVTPIVELFLAGAAFESRHAPEEVEGEHPVMASAKRGFDAIHHCK